MSEKRKAIGNGCLFLLLNNRKVHSQPSQLHHEVSNFALLLLLTDILNAKPKLTMKKTVLLLALLFSMSANAQTITVPDANFRSFLATTYNATISGNDVTFTSPAIVDITTMYCSSQGISDLTGIANFTSLTELYCSNNSLTSLDVSALSQLQILYCNNNLLNAINVSGLTNLLELWCFQNSLSSIDVSTNTNLQILSCESNFSLTGISFGSNVLQQLLCSNCNITGTLDCGNKALSTLDCSNNPSLETLLCKNNSLTFLNVSGCTGLKTLICDNNTLSNLDLSSNTLLEIFYCDNNQFGSGNLDVSSNLNLKELNCRYNSLTSLNVSSNSQLEALRASFNLLSAIDVSNNPQLKDLRLVDNNLSTVDVSNNPNLDLLSTAINPIGSLDVSNLTNLRVLACYSNGLSTLNLSNNPLLDTLYCYSNSFTSLDLSANNALIDLRCDTNSLTSLDVTNMPNLVVLHCNNNQITGALNVSQNTSLNELKCHNNKIPIILTDLDGVPNITRNSETQVAVFVSDVQNPTISSGETGGFILGNTGAIVNLVSNTGSGSLTTATGTNPNIVPPLPTGVNVVSPDKFWTINQTGLSTFSYNLILDLTGVSGIQNFNLLRILKRNNNTVPWQDVSQTPISATVEYLEPFIIISGLNSFSDFSIGSDVNDNQLPVTLSAFNGRPTAEGVALQWTTQSEQNNLGFDVLRKVGEGEFLTIASHQSHRALRGRGTTASTSNYAFLDESVEAGKTYTYRLRSFDFDGTIHDYAPTVTVEVRDAIQNRITKYALLQNYPNPFNPTTSITYELPKASDVSLKVFDMLGREVATLVNERQERGRYSATFNANTLSSGIYFYRLQAGNFVQTKKMMLVK